MSYGKRLQQAMEHAKKDRKALAAELGMSVQAVGQVITGGRSGEQRFNSENNSRAARFLRIDAHWLATGDGEMHSETTWPFLVLKPDELLTLHPDDLAAVEQIALNLLRRGQKTGSSISSGGENVPRVVEQTQINRKMRPSGKSNRIQKTGS